MQELYLEAESRRQNRSSRKQKAESKIQEEKGKGSFHIKDLPLIIPILESSLYILQNPRSTKERQQA